MKRYLAVEGTPAVDDLFHRAEAGAIRLAFSLWNVGKAFRAVMREGGSAGFRKRRRATRPGRSSGKPSRSEALEGFASCRSEEIRGKPPVRIDPVGMQIVHNATSGFNETVEVNRTS